MRLLKRRESRVEEEEEEEEEGEGTSWEDQRYAVDKAKEGSEKESSQRSSTRSILFSGLLSTVEGEKDAKEAKEEARRCLVSSLSICRAGRPLG